MRKDAVEELGKKDGKDLMNGALKDISRLKELHSNWLEARCSLLIVGE